MARTADRFTSGLMERDIKSKEDVIQQRIYPADPKHPRKTDQIVHLNSSDHDLSKYQMHNRYGDQLTSLSGLFGGLVRSFIDIENWQRVTYYYENKDNRWRIVRSDLPDDFKLPPVISPTQSTATYRWGDPVLTGQQRRGNR